ncbi:MAG: hypothetical protein K2J54_04285 [Clostridia bacterium]|nr:hypothetical protein [Clostridia bacterium]
MEENENKTFEIAEEEVSQPSREEILATAREENKDGDEREKQFFVKANSLAVSIGLVFAGLIILVSSLVEKRVPVEVMLIAMAMQSVQAFIAARGVRKTRKLYLAVGIVEAALAVLFLVIWILQLCGVL